MNISPVEFLVYFYQRCCFPWNECFAWNEMLKMQNFTQSLYVQRDAKKHRFFYLGKVIKGSDNEEVSNNGFMMMNYWKIRFYILNKPYIP
jgi:hypothetical protein